MGVQAARAAVLSHCPLLCSHRSIYNRRGMLRGGGGQGGWGKGGGWKGGNDEDWEGGREGYVFMHLPRSIRQRGRGPKECRDITCARHARRQTKGRRAGGGKARGRIFLLSQPGVKQK